MLSFAHRKFWRCFDFFCNCLKQDPNYDLNMFALVHAHTYEKKNQLKSFVNQIVNNLNKFNMKR